MGLNPSDPSGTTNSIPVNLDLGLKGQPFLRAVYEQKSNNAQISCGHVRRALCLTLEDGISFPAASSQGEIPHGQDSREHGGSRL